MAIYAIGDLHLSLGCDKKMDQFPGWEDYVARITKNWKNRIGPEDTVVVAGDISWGMTLEQARPDFALLESLPGTKYLLKGNHDYWWNSAAKMNGFFADNGFSSLRILHNNSYEAEGVWLCGSRGWLFENGQPHDDKIISREAMRIEASLASAQGEGERILFLHYPPIYGDQLLRPFVDLMAREGIKRCYYGHIHGAGHRAAVRGMAHGVEFFLISADYLAFDPLEVQKMVPKP